MASRRERSEAVNGGMDELLHTSEAHFAAGKYRDMWLNDLVGLLKSDQLILYSAGNMPVRFKCPPESPC